MLEKYKKLHGLKGIPDINEKSKSLQRTIDDLYTWDQQRQKKIEMERKKRESPTQSMGSSRGFRPQDSVPVEERLINQGLKTQQKINIQIKQRNQEILQQSTPKLNKGYVTRVRNDSFHNHYVDAEPVYEKGELIEPPLEEFQTSRGSRWVELSLLERNELFINIKNAKIKKAQTEKYDNETDGCTFEPQLTRYDPIKLSIIPLQEDMTRSKVSSSLDRIMHTKYKNRNYAEIHKEQLRQRSLERNFIYAPINPLPRQREEFVEKYHKTLFLKPSEIVPNAGKSAQLYFNNRSAIKSAAPPNKIIQYLQSSKDRQKIDQEQNYSSKSSNKTSIKKLKNKKSKFIMLKSKASSRNSKISSKKGKKTNVIRLNAHKRNLNRDLGTVNDESFKPSFKPSISTERSKLYVPISERLGLKAGNYTFVGQASYTQKSSQHNSSSRANSTDRENDSEYQQRRNMRKEQNLIMQNY